MLSIEEPKRIITEDRVCSDSNEEKVLVVEVAVLDIEIMSIFIFIHIYYSGLLKIDDAFNCDTNVVVLRLIKKVNLMDIFRHVKNADIDGADTKEDVLSDKVPDQGDY